MLKCTLCHMPFRPPTEHFKGDEVWEFNRDDSGKNSFHPPCFRQTSQGGMGFKPHRMYIFGKEEQLDLFQVRNVAS